MAGSQGLSGRDRDPRPGGHCEGHAVLFITHERDGLDQVDQIVVLDHGRVAEQGSHQQLRHAGGHYQRIWESEYEYEHVC